MNQLIYGDNLKALQTLPDESVDLIYIDPPFNTGKVQKRTTIKTVHDQNNGDRVGFSQRLYSTEKQGTMSYHDIFENDGFYAFLEPRLIELYRVLKPSGSLFFHIDYREAAYCKIMLDRLFGRASFINEIIWAYDYGARSKTKWPAKHDNIFFYAKNPDKYTFNYDAIDRIPYLAPDLVGPTKAALGKTLTDSWFNTIVGTNSKEKTGYPTQKPLKIVERIVRVHSNQGDLVLDCFAGSGTLGYAAWKHGRNYTMIDQNPEAIAVMKHRLAASEFTYSEV